MKICKVEILFIGVDTRSDEKFIKYKIQNRKLTGNRINQIKKIKDDNFQILKNQMTAKE